MTAHTTAYTCSTHSLTIPTHLHTHTHIKHAHEIRTPKNIQNMPLHIIQCNFHPFTFYLPFHTLSPVDQCPIYATSNCTMGLDTCARHSLFGRTDPYYIVILYSSCGLNKRPAATLAFPLSVSVLSSQYLFQRGPIWVIYCYTLTSILSTTYLEYQTSYNAI